MENWSRANEDIKAIGVGAWFYLGKPLTQNTLLEFFFYCCI